MSNRIKPTTSPVLLLGIYDWKNRWVQYGMAQGSRNGLLFEPSAAEERETRDECSDIRLTQNRDQGSQCTLDIGMGVLCGNKIERGDAPEPLKLKNLRDKVHATKEKCGAASCRRFSLDNLQKFGGSVFLWLHGHTFDD